jgi:hypothetical protein
MNLPRMATNSRWASKKSLCSGSPARACNVLEHLDRDDLNDRTRIPQLKMGEG